MADDNVMVNTTLRTEGLNLSISSKIIIGLGVGKDIFLDPKVFGGQVFTLCVGEVEIARCELFTGNGSYPSHIQILEMLVPTRSVQEAIETAVQQITQTEEKAIEREVPSQ